MIVIVSLMEGIIWNQVLWCFEVGMLNIGGIIGFGVVLIYVSQLGLMQIVEYEQMLMCYVFDVLCVVLDLIFYGLVQCKGVIVFNFGQYYVYDVGSFFDNYGIVVWIGYYCVMLLMVWYQVLVMCWVLLVMYNIMEEVDCLVVGFQWICKLLG